MMSSKRRKFCSADEEEEKEEEENNNVICIKDRVYFYAPVTKENVLILIQKLEEASNHVLSVLWSSGVRRVLLFVNSSGGEVHSGLSAMNHIQINKVPVFTIADGFVASAATFLLLGGEKKFAMQHSVLLIHQLSTGFFWGKFGELLDEVENSSKLMETLKKVYESYTNMKPKQIDSLLRKEITLSGERILKLGFAESFFGD
jgi:ATP-dependent protease ClpP protease subunit